MSKKMPKRLVALSASAVAAIYIAGLVSTQPTAEGVTVASAAANSALVATPGVSLTSTAANSTSAPVVVGASMSATPASSASATPVAASASATPLATSTPVPTAPPTTSGASSYANGTYSATGTSRFGTVSVSVTTAGGKLTNVQITRVTTSYPVSRIASLPAQVIQNQSANVNVVTGATYSSQAFKQAVQQALAQALAASSTTTGG